MRKYLLKYTASAVVIAMLTTTSAFADLDRCTKDSFCQKPEKIGKQIYSSRVDKRLLDKAPKNTEFRNNGKSKSSQCGLGKELEKPDLPFRISIDGAPIASDDVINGADITRCVDKALDRADIQVRFDSLTDNQALNITAVPRTAVRGEKIVFTPYSNYTNYIKKAEIRIFEDKQSVTGRPLQVIKLASSLNKDAFWTAPKKSKLDSVKYVLRVYDNSGRFDETAPVSMRLVDKARKIDDLQKNDREKLAGYGENNLAIKNISVSGGIITVNGKNVKTGTKVTVMGVEVPVDKGGKFVYRQVMPAGRHNVEIVTEDPNGIRGEFTRSLYIPEQDWFYIALADLTIGKSDTSGPVHLVRSDNSDRNKGRTYADGRLAFYVKGKIKGKYLLTASADTKEQPFEDLFSNFTSKDPRYLLRRIDPNAYYPIYGDDSTTVEDAPTQGKFYVKLQADKSHVLWGNFKTKITGTDLLNYNRALYGANAEYSSQNMTSFGDSRTEIDAFAADPGTVSSYEEFRGTGGSLYYLRRQDLVIGSERLRIETRDKDSGIILSSKSLVYGQDYEINYIQGRIMLNEALASTTDDGNTVKTGSISGNPLFLVVNYEYSPGVTELNNLTKGGRASHWLNDYVKLGVAAYDQKGSGLDQLLAGVDATIRYKEGTYIKLERARSDGAGNGGISSLNGGFNFNTIDQTTTNNIKADAYRAELNINLPDITKDKYNGKISAYTISRDNGFSGQGQFTSEDIMQHGFIADLPVSDKFTLNAKGDYKLGSTTGKIRTGEVSGNLKVSKENSLDLAVRFDDRGNTNAGGVSNILSKTGSRTDVAVKYLYTPLNDKDEKERYEIYALGQLTANNTGNRNKNNRLGLGGKYSLNDRVSLTGEGSVGSSGWGSQVGIEYAKSDRTNYYLNYLIDTDRTDMGYRGKRSNLVVGGKSRYTDSLSVFGEERYQTYDSGASGLIHSFGLDYSATDRWTFGGRFENGTVFDRNAGDIKRTAVSFSSGYQYEKTKYIGNIEFRLEEGNVTGDRATWLMKNNLVYQTNANWRFLGDFDIAMNSLGNNSNLDIDFINIKSGYAYRPIANDKFNALFRYEYLQDSAITGQLSASGSGNASNFEQKSHVLSIDTIYDIFPKLSLGGKVGYRFGQLRDKTISGSDFFDSQAYLLIGRADYHIVKEWDIVGEIRYLDVKEAKDSKFGALVAGYKHVNQNLKMGVGYNFTDFSDDLTDLSYTSEGAFFNVVGKF